MKLRRIFYHKLKILLIRFIQILCLLPLRMRKLPPLVRHQSLALQIKLKILFNIPDQEDATDTGSFQNLAVEFSVEEKTSPAIIPELAEIVNSLLALRDRLTKEKLSEVQAQCMSDQRIVLI